MPMLSLKKFGIGPEIIEKDRERNSPDSHGRRLERNHPRILYTLLDDLTEFQQLAVARIANLDVRMAALRTKETLTLHTRR